MKIDKKKAWLAGAVLASATLFTIVAIAAIDNEVNGCVNNKTGAVRIINFLGGVCTKSETALTWNKQGVQGIQGIQGEAGPQGPAGKQLHLYDANGQDLGIVLGMPPTYETYIPEAKVSLRITEKFELVDGPISIYFLTADCTGVPYTSGSMAYPYGYGINGSHFYKPTNAPYSGITYFSRYEWSQNSLCIVGSGNLTSALELTEIPAPFTLPLALPLKVENN